MLPLRRTVAGLATNARELGANTRKNISFTVAATIFGLGLMLWAGSAVVATQADVVRPLIGTSPHLVISNSYLPIQALDETY
jgi:hypothetical protein